MELGTFARLALLTSVLSAAAGPSFAQDKPAAPDKAGAPIGAGVATPGPMSQTPPAPPQPDWVKLCKTDPNAKKEVCMTSRDLRTETGQTVASVAIRAITGESKKFVLAAVPPGLLLQPGIRVAVDQSSPVNGKFSICFPNACYAELEVNDAFFKALQKGQNLVIQAMNQEAKTLNFPVSLGGFSKAYEGAAIDPKEVEESNRLKNEDMARVAKERREQLQVPNSPAIPTDGGPAMPGGKAQVKGQ